MAVDPFFGEQNIRLLRERWGSAQELAEELFAMAKSRDPITTDQPVTIYRDNPDQPAIRIVDRSDGSSPPIQIVGGKAGTPAVDPGGYKCCTDKGGGSGGGGGGGGTPSPPPTLPGGGGGGGGLGGSGQPGATPARLFLGELTIQVHCNPPDTFGWDGQSPSISCTQCVAYNPPTIPAPVTCQPFACIQNKLKALLADPTLAPFLSGYDVLADTVSGPFDICTKPQ